MLKISGFVYVQGTEDSTCQNLANSSVEGSADPYGPERGTVNIRLSSAANLPEDIKLFFMEHRSQSRKQHVLTARTGQEISVDLPCGEYTMQILARGFETIRGLAEVDPNHPFVVNTVLKPRKTKRRTFEERLVKYGIDLTKEKIGDLKIPSKKKHVLNHEQDQEKQGFRMLQTNNIAELKKWIGSDDSRFGHARPIYGPLPDRHQLTRLREDNLDLRKLHHSEVKAIMAIAREYIHGNSRAVALYEPILNEAIKILVSDSLVNIPFYLYRTVTIGPGATLEVGAGSALFACDELRIHTTGQLKPVGDVTIEVGTYTEFQ